MKDTDDLAGINISSHILIRDKTNNKILVSKRETKILFKKTKEKLEDKNE